MSEVAVVERARESFERKAWAESYRLLQAAEREGALEPEDLERLAMAAYLMGRDDESESAMARAHQMFLDRGEQETRNLYAATLRFPELQFLPRPPAAA